MSMYYSVLSKLRLTHVRTVSVYCAMTPPYHQADEAMTPILPDPDAAATPRRRHRPYQPRPKPDVFLAIPSRGTRDGKRLRALRADLVRHVGGAPSAVQSVLIDRIVMLQWQAIQMDRASADMTAPQAALIADRAVSLANTIGRALARLGLQSAPAPVDNRPVWERIDFSGPAKQAAA
jgi:hypothetical protein